MKHLPIILAAVAIAVSVGCASQSTAARPTPCAAIPTDAEAKPYHTHFFYTDFLNDGEGKYIAYGARELSLESWLQEELSKGYVFHSITPAGKAPNLEAEILSHGRDNWILATTEYDPIAASCHPAYSPPIP